MIPLKLDISQVGMSNGDFAVGQVGSALEPYLEQIAIEMSNYCQERKTVVFLPLISTSQRFCRLLNKHGLTACEVNGESSDRDEVLADFEDGKYNVLCNSMLLTEGWDCPSVDCIVVLRPTKIRSLYQQMVGRGMRLSPGKENLLLLDFLWMTEKHDLCKPSSLVSKDKNIADEVDEIISDGEIHDVIEADEEAKRSVLAEREETLARELESNQNNKSKIVDPIQFALSIAAEDLAAYEPTFAWEKGPPSSKQIAFLHNKGISTRGVYCAGLASFIIERLIRRQKEGLSTPKQILCLERYGFKNVGTWSFKNANNLITRISRNGWKVPYGIIPQTYQPKEIDTYV